jgi:hypothetical protein
MVMAVHHFSSGALDGRVEFAECLCRDLINALSETRAFSETGGRFAGRVPSASVLVGEREKRSPSRY